MLRDNVVLHGLNRILNQAASPVSSGDGRGGKCAASHSTPPSQTLNIILIMSQMAAVIALNGFSIHGSMLQCVCL